MADRDAENVADYVIVGAGSAGSLMADRLSADGRHKVVVIEAGGSDRRLWIRMPIGYGKAFHDAAINWRFRTQPEAALGDRQLYWPRGKVLGGSSSINAMVYCRGLPHDFDDWRAAGNPGWAWRDMAPIFESLERRIGPADGATADGRLAVADMAALYHPLKRHFYAAASELGLPRTSDMNGANPEGVGPYHLTVAGGFRFSAADAFLRPALRRANMRLLSRTLVTEILIDGGRATGVRCRARGRTRGRELVVHAGVVILAAGAVGSPHLLQLSGIGPGELLQELGLPVRHRNDAVGAGLQDHLGIDYAYEATEPTLNDVLGTWPGRLGAAARYLALRRGPLALSVNQMGGLVRSDPGQPHPDLQLYFNPISYATVPGHKRPLLRPDRFNGFILSFNACRPLARGTIRAACPDPAAPPLISPNYLSDPADEAGALAGARLIGRFEGTEAMRRLIRRRLGIDLGSAGDDEILDDFRARAGTVFHPCGTCRMAPPDRGGVVGTDLAVHGIGGLHIVDASIFPNVTSANTNAPTIATAQRAAGLILAAR